MTEQSRPKPIELVARAITQRRGRDPDSDVPVFTTWEVPGGMGWAAAQSGKTEPAWHNEIDAAKAAFDILIKHGCISIEGIIARDEELARVAPVPERAGE